MQMCSECPLRSRSWTLLLRLDGDFKEPYAAPNNFKPLAEV